MLTVDQGLSDGELAMAVRTEAKAGRFANAAKLAVAALQRGLVEPTFHEVIGLELINRGRHEQAIVELGRGLALDPSNLRMMASVGLCLLELERNLEAHDVFLTILRQDQRQAAAHFGFGTALSRLGDYAGARREYQFTVERDPEHAPALAGLALLCQADGETDAARAYAERALQIEPDHVEANIALARIEIAQKDFEPAEARLRKVLARSPLNPRHGGAARTLLGDVLDARGEHASAFEFYESGNAAMRAAFAPLFDKVTESPTQQTLRIARGFAAAEFASPAPAAPAPDAPLAHVFLVGFPRSGTTLLEQVLASHGQVVSLEERPTLPAIEQDFEDVRAGFEALASDAQALAAHRAAYWEAVRAFGAEPAGKVFIDKLPLNTARLPAIHLLFPNAKILFAVRDPRDVTLSCFRRGFSMNAAMFEFLKLDHAAAYYDAVMQAAALYREKLPLDLYEIRYERLVSQFDEEAQAVLKFLGLDWSEDLRDFAESARRRVIRTPSAPQVRRGLYKDALGQWRNYGAAMQPVLPLLARWVEYFGYPAS